MYVIEILCIHVHIIYHINCTNLKVKRINLTHYVTSVPVPVPVLYSQPKK